MGGGDSEDLPRLPGTVAASAARGEDHRPEGSPCDDPRPRLEIRRQRQHRRDLPGQVHLPVRDAGRRWPSTRSRTSTRASRTASSRATSSWPARTSAAAPRASRPRRLKAAGVPAVVAKSFARIFFRNAINLGLPVLDAPETVNALRTPAIEVEIDLSPATIRSANGTFPSAPLPASVIGIIAAGGLIDTPRANSRQNRRLPMPKHKIAMLPGDGVGKDVIEAARIVLDKLGLDAEYVHGDIGWEFWCKEGNALPERTIELLQETDALLFGAITSKPKEDAAPSSTRRCRARACPTSARSSGCARSSTSTPTCGRARPTPATRSTTRTASTSSSSARTPRACTPASSSTRCPQVVRDALADHPEDEALSRTCRANEIAVSTRIMTRKRLRAHRPGGLRVRPQARPQVGDRRREAQRAARDGRPDARRRPRGRQGLSRHRALGGQHRRHVHVADQEPAGLRRARRREHVRRHHLRPGRPARRRAGLRLQRQHRRQVRRLRADPRLGARSTPASTRSTRSPRSWPPS